MTLSRQYVKLCDLPDFEDPAVLRMLRSILPERDPETHIERKVWEFAMTALFLEDVGLLGDSTETLSVGAGDERILFWLANRLGKVVATDVYGEGAFSGNEANPSMLEDPRAHAPYPFREDHLEVLWMDARELSFPDASFDAVFTLSSIEHFGAPADIARSASEIGRVLKPGGYAIVVTECLVRHDLRDRFAAIKQSSVRAWSRGQRRPRATLRRRDELAEVFTARELQELIVEPSGLELLQPLDLELGREAWDNVTTLHFDGRIVPRTGHKYPSILIRVSHSVFTSVCLVMQKPRSR